VVSDDRCDLLCLDLPRAEDLLQFASIRPLSPAIVPAISYGRRAVPTGVGRSLRASGGPEDVRVRRQESRRAEREALARLDLKPGVLDPARRVTRQVTAARDMRPESRVGEPLKT
jgi:hypothetical protein